ncbi:MAG: Si-specific NAD(P)(+) transhydrogenase [Deltaproteobacteria bacterium]|nr:Si-specific NAD(P)(+) transhydrogenase [Deltaproteobacteria bacterium]
MSSKFDYDLVVIGSGPSGQKAAIQAVKLNKRVALVDLNPHIGGICLYDGTIPSKSFREAILHLSGYRERAHYGKSYCVKDNIGMQDLIDRCFNIQRDIEQNIRSQLSRNKVEIIRGIGSISAQHHVTVTCEETARSLSTHTIVIATGSRPRRPDGFDYDDEVILDSDTLLHISKLPRSMTIVGGGVIGCEYGSMFAALGVKVTILEAQSRLLSFVEEELIDSLVYRLREQKASIITCDKVTRCLRTPDGRTVTYLESGKRVVSDIVLISAGRVPNTEALGLEKLNIKRNARGNIEVNEHFQTSVENIYAVGDIIGAPALASTSMEQGRRAACHAFGLTDRGDSLPIPSGIFAIPEIAMVGKTTTQLSAEKIPYEFGVSRFSEVDRGKIIGDNGGVLKILFHRNTLQILGVHIIGENATELIHIGQTVMSLQGTIDYLCQAVFNYPTLSQAYKTAALDGMNKIISTQDIPDEIPLINGDLEALTSTIN